MTNQPEFQQQGDCQPEPLQDGNLSGEHTFEAPEPYEFRVLKEQGSWALSVQTRRLGTAEIEEEKLVSPGDEPWRGRSYEELLKDADEIWRPL